MKKSIRLSALLLALILAVTTLAACGNKAEPAGGAASASGKAAISSSLAEAAPKEVTITDDVGRELTIPGPDYLEKVYVTSPIGFIFMYTLALDKLAGTPMELSDAELAYMNPACADMPFLGGMQMGGELNREAIINSGAQVMLSMGSAKPKDTDADSADELQEQLNIPVVVIDASMDNIINAYKFLGEMLGVEERASVLAAYCKSVFDDVVAKIENIPGEKRISVYYAEGPDGLSTEPASSGHAGVLKYAGANIVADVEAVPGSGMSPVSLEQILAWNPEVIITWGDARGGACSMIRENTDWGNIDAVKEGRVYAMPSIPFSWMDRPPSVNRFLGIQWVANLLYPEVYDIDIKEATKEFYSLFYSVDLTGAQVDELLQNAIA